MKVLWASLWVLHTVWLAESFSPPLPSCRRLRISEPVGTQKPLTVIHGDFYRNFSSAREFSFVQDQPPEGQPPMELRKISSGWIITEFETDFLSRAALRELVVCLDLGHRVQIRHAISLVVGLPSGNSRGAWCSKLVHYDDSFCGVRHSVSSLLKCACFGRHREQ
jgi:hypothetical protein